MSARPRGDRRLRLAAPVLAALVCLGAAACTSSSGKGPAPSAGPSSTPASASTSAGPVTLRFAVYGDAPVLAAYRKLAATWNADHPDVTVKLEASGDAVTSEDKVDRNFVISSDPPAGETLPPGATVHLLVSDGPERTALVMPDLTGKDLDLTADRLNEAGFVVLVQRGNGLWNDNRIKTAVPEPGAMVAEGDTIRLFGR